MDKLIKNKAAGFKGSRLGLLALLFSALPATAAPLLYEVRYNPLLNGETEIEFVFDEPLVQEPRVELLQQPARLSLTFPTAELEQRLANVNVGQAGVSAVRSALNDEGVNSVIAMDTLKVYRTRLNDNVFSVHLADTPQITRPGSGSQINPSFINQLPAPLAFVLFHHGYFG